MNNYEYQHTRQLLEQEFNNMEEILSTMKVKTALDVYKSIKELKQIGEIEAKIIALDEEYLRGGLEKLF